ncbi:50S ribosomal protein L23 [Candidatus Nomurabacteria bacterium]|nr:50S ribosomal protein L23 [Candidatus Nomurabacteria bacterium]USN94773.1 MAG: 50S ribosomal protein L23 [Candidatus Nomurabacteria bacterium]
MATKDKTKEVSKAKIVSGRDPRDVILNPRVTEKASFGVAQNAYTFDVNPRSTKTEIKEAIEILYKKTPVKISVTTIKPKTIFRRGNLGKKSGGKKAVVYFKKGDSITVL